MEKVDKIKAFLSISNGNGDGNGNGYGYGNGYGNGNGNGDGYGYGIKTYDGQAVYVVDGTKTLIESVHGSYAKGYILNGDLTLSPCYIAKRGNFFAHGGTLAEAVRDAESKYAQNLPTEERIRLFVEAHPTDQPNTRYPAKDLYEWHHTLTGSCDAGRRAFAKEHDIDLTSATLTVEEFISLTRNAYGGDVIKQLAEHYAHPTKNKS